MADKKQSRPKAPSTSSKRPSKKTTKPAAQKRGATKRRAPASPPAAQTGPDSQTSASTGKRGREGGRAFPVVAIGASAGGLQAMTQLLRHLPGDTGMAFVFLQHLDSRHASHLPDLLGRVTPMPVVEIVSGQRLEPNRVHVMPPNVEMTIVKGVVKLAKAVRTGRPARQIDKFFESLAHERGHLAIGVVLSGTGSDGTLGLQAIKAEGGVTFAQDEATAEFKGMPHSVVSAGAADFVLAPEEIGRKLAQLRDHPLVRKPKLPTPAPPPSSDGAEALNKIIALLRTATGVDFAAYKPTSLGRRIQRRMMLNGIDSLPAYAEHLQRHPDELAGLHDDIFIGVTSFFRDPDVYRVLQQKVFPRLAEKRNGDKPVRIWVPGCSTGEEVYSLAILWLEFAEGLAKHVPVQLFGTDISPAAIDTARAGRYPEGVTSNVTPERLRNYFAKTAGGYQIAKRVRDLCVFAPHNLLSDPPFTQLDLLCCRNVLIYLQPDFQQKLLQLYHHALRPTGYLVLGLSEDVGRQSDLFAVVDKKYRVYAKKPSVQPPLQELLPVRPTWSRYAPEQPAASPVTVEAATPQQVAAAADRLALAKYAPAGVIVDSNLDILQFRGHVGAYLEPAPGLPTRSLNKMAREGLQVALTSLVRKAQKGNQPARQEGLRVKSNGQLLRVTVEVTPFQVAPHSQERYFLVTFEQAPPATAPPAEPRKPARGQAGSARRVAQLERELEETRASLQTVVEERDANTEELVAALEELQSGNEELQATNEELQSAKEELQSANEELTTLNEELENRNQELSLALGNLSNVLDSVRIPIVIVGGNLRIRLYNPAAERVLSIVSTDIGRRIGEVKTRLSVAELEPLIQQVMQTLEPYDTEVQDRGGRWYAMRIRPYQSVDNKIDGVVMTWSDISALKASLRQAPQMRDNVAELIATVREPLLVLDPELRVQVANQPFYDLFRVSPEETRGRLVYELGQGQWNIPELRRLLEEILPESSQFQGLEVEGNFPGLGHRRMLLNARRVQPSPAQGEMIMLAIEDVTAIQQLTELGLLRQLSGRLQAVREDERTKLSREIHDELGSTLTGLKMMLYQLRSGLTDEQASLHGIVREMSDLIDSEIHYVRQMAGRLRTHILDDLGLGAAIDWQLGEFQKQTGIAVGLRDSAGPVVLQPERLTAAYRVFQEALTNVARHAQASAVEVTLEVQGGELHLQVHDDGRGIPSENLAGEGALGLMGMRERAQAAGGQLDIRSIPGDGTVVHLRLPLGR